MRHNTRCKIKSKHYFQCSYRSRYVVVYFSGQMHHQMVAKRVHVSFLVDVLQRVHSAAGVVSQHIAALGGLLLSHVVHVPSRVERACSSHVEVSRRVPRHGSTERLGPAHVALAAVFTAMVRVAVGFYKWKVIKLSLKIN